MREEENSQYIFRIYFFSFISLDLNQRYVRMLKLEAMFQFLYKLLPEFDEV